MKKYVNEAAKLAALVGASLSFALGSEWRVKPFVTDFCTGFPEGTRADPKVWASCCVRHDLEFWAGGTRKERIAADLSLRQCVQEKGFPFIAYVIWTGVRAGSFSPIRISGMQWGNAWGPRVRRTSLSEAELVELEDRLRADASIDLALIDDFVRSRALSP